MNRKSEIELTNMCLVYNENRVLVQEKADDTADHIVGGGGDPKAQISPGVETGQIIEAEHDPVAHQSVDNANRQKLQKTFVKELAK